MAGLAYNEQKLDELVLYVALRCENDPFCGAVKLNKILFFADFMAYKTLGCPITGAHYVKLQLGPVPHEVDAAKRRLEASGRARQRESKLFPAGFAQKRVVALDDPDLKLFSSSEIAIVDQVIDQLRMENASTVSELSHRFPGWKLAEFGEDIPYESALLPSDADEFPELTDDDKEWAQGVAARL
jgi:hypothetical protein